MQVCWRPGDLRPFGAAEVAAMSAATSPTGLAYGLRRVCAAWGMARSSFYASDPGRRGRRKREAFCENNLLSPHRCRFWRQSP